jgi:hypothetical protein
MPWFTPRTVAEHRRYFEGLFGPRMGWAHSFRG